MVVEMRCAAAGCGDDVSSGAQRGPPSRNPLLARAQSPRTASCHSQTLLLKLQTLPLRQWRVATSTTRCVHRCFTSSPQPTSVTRRPTLRRHTRRSHKHAHAACSACVARPPPQLSCTHHHALTDNSTPLLSRGVLPLLFQVFHDDDEDDVTSPGGLAASPVRSKTTAGTGAADLTTPGPATATLEATPLVRVCLSTLWR